MKMNMSSMPMPRDKNGTTETYKYHCVGFGSKNTTYKGP